MIEFESIQFQLTCKACLVALYVAEQGGAYLPQTDELTTTCPCFFDKKYGTTIRLRLSNPKTLVSKRSRSTWIFISFQMAR